MGLFKFFIQSGEQIGYHLGCLPFAGRRTSVEIPEGSHYHVGEYGAITLTDPLYEAHPFPHEFSVSDGTNEYTVQVLLDRSKKSPVSVVHVDPRYGSNEGDGSQENPITSLTLATKIVRGGGTILLYGGSYEGVVLGRKPLTIRAVEGEAPLIGSITSSQGGSFVFEGLHIVGDGINCGNLVSVSSGSVTLRGCMFDSEDQVVRITRYPFVQLIQNRIHSKGGHGVSIDVIGSKEVNILSNVVYGEGLGKLIVQSAKEVSLLSNTFNGLSEILLDDAGSSVSYGVSFVVVSQEILDRKQIVFPKRFRYSGGSPAVSINLSTGSSQRFGTDWTASGGTISWQGLGMSKTPAEGGAKLGEVIRIQYEFEGEGEQAPSGRVLVDSNNITSVGGLSFTSGLFSIVSYNNLYGTTVGVPIPPTNIVDDPKYVNEGEGDFHLAQGSPCRGSGNPNQGGTFTGRSKVSPYQNLRDIDDASRMHLEGRPDIGAQLYLLDKQARTEPFVHMAQEGYDKINSGDVNKPVRKFSYALSQTEGDTISMDLGNPTEGVSRRKAYVEEEFVRLTNAVVVTDEGVGEIRQESLVLAPFDAPSLRGDRVYVSIDGDDLGDGSVGSPYRTLDRALEDSASVVCVLAGHYPFFTGVPGKTLMFLPRYMAKYRGASGVSDMSATSWEVLETDNLVKYELTPIRAKITHRAE